MGNTGAFLLFTIFFWVPIPRALHGDASSQMAFVYQIEILAYYY